MFVEDVAWVQMIVVFVNWFQILKVLAYHEAILGRNNCFGAVKLFLLTLLHDRNKFQAWKGRLSAELDIILVHKSNVDFLEL